MRSNEIYGSDIKFWTEDRNNDYIEIFHFERMLTSLLFKQVENSKSLNVDTYYRDSNLQILNESFQDQLVNFVTNLKIVRKCDDVQCETFYLNNHLF
jgi:hypothetical protein